MNKQKFYRGDLVHVVADLGSSMAHFRADADAIVMGSYRDQYGGSNGKDYTLMFVDNASTCSWYHEHQLTFIRHVGEHEIHRIQEEVEEREKNQSKLPWIVQNWKTVRTQPSGKTMAELMRLVGITNPWGPRGEGITLYSNQLATLALLDPILSTGNLGEVEEFLKTIPLANG